MTTPPIPVPPAPPAKWTIQTIVIYVASIALWVLGLLVLAGVGVPTRVSSVAQVVIFAVLAVAGSFTAVVPKLTQTYVQGKAVAAGYDAEQIKALPH